MSDLASLLRPLLGAHADATTNHILDSPWYADTVKAAEQAGADRIRAAVETVPHDRNCGLHMRSYPLIASCDCPIGKVRAALSEARGKP